MSDMLREIHEQPDWVRRALETERANVAALAKAIRDLDIRTVVIAARGTSDHAAVYAKYLFEIVARMPVSLAAPSVYTLYDAQPRLANCLVLGISQSGCGSDVVHVLSSARAAGALTACVTNSIHSPITEVSDHVLLCHAGEERSVAATKTYTTALAVVAQLVGALAEDQELLGELSRIPDAMRKALDVDGAVLSAVERFRSMEECAVLARGVNQPTALEAALKMTETSYIVAKPYSAADFLHGPIALVEPGFPCFLYAPPGRAYTMMLDVAAKVRERGGEMVIASSEPEILGLAAKPLPMWDGVSELLSPLVYILPGQLFACRLAVARGENPDRPRGLSKVTSTL